MKNLAKHVDAMKQWVKESREKYNKRMRTEANKKAKNAVDWKEGDLVSLSAIKARARRSNYHTRALIG